MEIPYAVKPRKETGLFNSKIGIWLFLASEVMLFGGLFSSYLFLRIYSDYAWPERALPVLPGMINTFVLIGSSVTIVFAWLSLKFKQWRRFQIYLWLTIFCAVTFMVLKGIEYKTKFHHQAVKFQDNVVIQGHSHLIPVGDHGPVYGKHDSHKKEGRYAPANSFFIKGERISISPQNFYIPYIEKIMASHKKEQVSFDLAENVLLQFEKDSSFFPRGTDLSIPLLNEISQYSEKISIYNASVERSQLKAELSDKKKGTQFLKELDFSLLEEVGRVSFLISPHQVFYFLPKELKKVSQNAFELRDGTILEGEIYPSIMSVSVDEIDFRQIALDAERKGISPEKEIESTWLLAQSEYQEIWESHQNWVSRLEKKLLSKKRTPSFTDRYLIKTSQLLVYSQDFNPFTIKEYFSGPNYKKRHFPHIEIPREEIYFESFLTPRWNNYYAIYFALTGLHGLHVLGGILIFMYYGVFGKKMYEKNPEKFTNGIEVSGLFWHFVDLVWIFLFPILYLM